MSFHSRDNWVLHHCYTVLTMYMADNTEISTRYVRSLNYTFYPLRDLPHKLPSTCSMQGSQHNQQSNSISNLEVVRGCESCRCQNTFSLPRVVPKFHLLGETLIGVYGLNLPEVGKLFFPSLPSFLMRTSRLKSNTTFNWTCIISLSQHSTPTKKDSITWTLSWGNNGYKNH